VIDSVLFSVVVVFVVIEFIIIIIISIIVVIVVDLITLLSIYLLGNLHLSQIFGGIRLSGEENSSCPLR